MVYREPCARYRSLRFMAGQFSFRNAGALVHGPLSEVLTMHYVYVFLSQKDNKFYIGLANNLERRISEHYNGEVVSTKARRPLKLIFYEAYLNEKDAVRREDYFKTSKGKRTLRLMLKDFLSHP